MPRIIPEPTIINASDVFYDNTISGLVSNNVQDAIDELAAAITSGSSIILGTHRALEDPGTLQELTDYLDDAQRPDLDTGNVSTAIYVNPSGNDDSGNGTSGSPFKTLNRAIQVIPKNSLVQRTILLSSGSFTLPVFGEDYNNITILGTSSTEETGAISSVNSSSQANGLVLTIGSPGWSIDEHRGKLMQFTSGALGGQYGLIYRNTSNTLYVSQDTRGFAFIIPAVSDTLRIISLDTTISLDSDTIINGCSGLIFRNIFFGGSASLYFNTCDEVQIHRSVFEAEFININDSGSLNVKTSYIKSVGTTFEGRGLIAAINQAHVTIESGTVIDGFNSSAARAHVFSNTQASISTCGEVVFRDLGVKGLYLHGTQIETLVGQVGGDATWRFLNCAAGLVINDDEGAGLKYDLPELHGNITSDYIVTATNGAWVRIAPGSSVTTTLVTNAVSADGGITNISQNSDLTYISGGFPAVSGFMSGVDHENLDTLVHNIAEDSYLEVTRVSGQISTVIVWDSAAKIKKIREISVSRTANQVSSFVEKQYDAAGSVVVGQTLTSTVVRSSGQVANIITVET